MYLSKLKKHIKSIFENLHLHTYDDVFRNSDGAFPDLVYSTLNEHFPQITLDKGYTGLKTLSNTIPEPNPSNFDWRFDSDTVGRIVESIKREQYKNIALFGTPSLFAAIREVNPNVTLYDVNEVIKRHFENDSRVITADLNSYDFSSTELFDCIVMDPPWYLSYYRSWIAKGTLTLEVEGDIYITLFKHLLRPRAETELIRIKQIADLVGEWEILENFVTYSTPVFEKELFNYKSVPCFGNWRVADLLKIKKMKESTIKMPKVIPKNEWARFEIGTQVIAIKVSKVDIGEIYIEYPYPENDTLIRSVSNRDQIRKNINFITSRNRGLIIHGTQRTYKALQMLEECGAETTKKNFDFSIKEQLEFEKILDTIYK